MRRFLVVGILLFVLVPASVRAGSSSESVIRFSHPQLSPGMAQMVTVVARDLVGHPLRSAHVVLVVHLATRTAHIHMKPTNARGMTWVVLHPSAALRGTRVGVDATISTRALSVPLSASFSILAAPASPVSPTAALTATPRRTATSTPGPTASSGTIEVAVEAVPSTAPSPIAVMVQAHDADGHALANVPVQATAVFSEGVVPVTGTTDSSGTARLGIDTRIAGANETVHVTASATWHGQTVFGSADAPLTVPPTPTPMPTATFVPTATPTNTPVPVATDVPYSTYTPAPTYTPITTATNIPTATPAATPAATPTATLPASCNGQSCMSAMLSILNSTRAQYGLGPLALDLTQSNGTASCVGSIGHSIAMQESGSIWHVNPAYPAASFPTNNCYYGGFNSPPVAQNVGMMGNGSEMNDLVGINNLMMGEQHDAAYCATYTNHACTILSRTYSRVGIGIYFVNDVVWLTEDFIG